MLGNYFLKHIIEGKIEGRIDVMGRRRRRHKQLLDDRTETTDYLKLKEVTFDPLCGELALKVAMDLSYQRLRNN